MIIIIDAPVLKQLAEIVLVSNTPHYLFKHLRRHSFVESIAQSCSIADFRETSQDIQTRGAFTDEDQLRTYVLICALSLKSERNVVTLLESLKEFRFRWVKQLTAFAIASIRHDTVGRIDLQFKVQQKWACFNSTSSLNSSSISIESKP
jgi:hypothetical protein